MQAFACMLDNDGCSVEYTEHYICLFSVICVHLGPALKKPKRCLCLEENGLWGLSHGENGKRYWFSITPLG